MLADDAYILLRYGRNLADGFGLVWNPGELPTEGFTSLPYVLLMAAVAKLGLSQIIFAHWLGIACTAGTVLLTWRLAKLVNAGHERENLLAAGLLALTTSLTHWSAAGMDMPVFMLLVVASSLSYLSFRQGRTPPALTGSLFALTAFTRPEGAVQKKT
jgi:arabinofuranosyltransferase